MRIQKQHTAFTLIELLVVMVIIGIVAGIGISSFKSHMQTAREAKVFSFANDVSQELKRQATLKETTVSFEFDFDNTLEDKSPHGLHVNYADDPSKYDFIESKNTFLGSHFLRILGIGGVSSDPYEPNVSAPNEASMSYLIRQLSDSAYARIQLNGKTAANSHVLSLYHYFHTSSHNLHNTAGGQTLSAIPNSYEANTWQHVLHTYKDGISKVYINGELIREDVFSDLGLTPVVFASFDRLHINASYDLSFDIDNLEIYPFAVDISNLQAPR